MPYSSQKLLYHPEALFGTSQRIMQPAPLKVYLELGENALAISLLVSLLRDLESLGTLAIELIGPSPFSYPHIHHFLELMRDSEMELGATVLATSLDTQSISLLVGVNWKWFCVIIDAGSPDSYAKKHKTPDSAWHRAWEGVNRLKSTKNRSNQLVGASFRVTPENYEDVYTFCTYSKAKGADYAKIGLLFDQIEWPEGALAEARLQASLAKRDLEEVSFQVHNLLEDRVKNLTRIQNYPICAMKEVSCFIAHTGAVYTCTTKWVRDEGHLGSLRDKSFREIWSRDLRLALTICHIPEESCRHPCTHERKNRRALQLASLSSSQLISLRHKDTSTHRNFI